MNGRAAAPVRAELRAAQRAAADEREGAGVVRDDADGRLADGARVERDGRATLRDDGGEAALEGRVGAGDGGGGAAGDEGGGALAEGAVTQREGCAVHGVDGAAVEGAAAEGAAPEGAGAHHGPTCTARSMEVEERSVAMGCRGVSTWQSQRCVFRIRESSVGLQTCGDCRHTTMHAGMPGMPCVWRRTPEVRESSVLARYAAVPGHGGSCQDTEAL